MNTAPTHILRTTSGSYLIVNPTPQDTSTIDQVMTTKVGTLKVDYVVEDPNWQTQKQWVEKRAIISASHIVSLEEL